MKKKDIDHFAKLIQTKKEELQSEIGYLEKNLLFNSQKDAAGDLSGYSFHMADQATDAMDREQNFMFASREGKYLSKLDEALDRVANGSYGKCKTCGDDITKNRLEAVPTATSCFKCKTKDKKEGL